MILAARTDKYEERAVRPICSAEGRRTDYKGNAALGEILDEILDEIGFQLKYKQLPDDLYRKERDDI